MDNSLMIGLATQKLLQQRMDVTANNLANMNTTGFKVEAIVARELKERPAAVNEDPSTVSFAEGWRLQRDMSTGPLQLTGNALDVAIESEGFFSIAGPGGETLYTRDGNFSLDADGRLVTRDGFAVLGGGGDIIIDEAAGPVTISQTGVISQNNAEVAGFDIVAFDTPEALDKRGNNLLAVIDQQPRDPEGLRVEQGYLEGSNVQAIVELTNMIEVSRTYQNVAKMISNQNSMREQAISKLAKLR